MSVRFVGQSKLVAANGGGLTPSIGRVVDGGYCVGCGACAVASDGAISIDRNQWGYYQAKLHGANQVQLSAASQVCPFADESPNETVLADRFVHSCQEFDFRIGKYRALWAGRINDVEAIVDSSSGGLTTWVCSKLLNLGLVDGVIHVGRAEDGNGELFRFMVSTSIEALRSGRKSQYYSLSFDEVLKTIRDDGRKYAFVGVPCYVRAMRSLARLNSDWQQKITYFIALVCGHMKSQAFAELLAWQMGVVPEKLSAFDFRVKLPDRDAASYAATAWSKADSVVHTTAMRELFGHNWGHAIFQLSACDYCDDIFGEAADICLGDAWLPEFVSDWRGTNIVVVRNSALDQILRDGQADDEVTLTPLSADRLALSQEGNFRHRRDGLSARLWDKKRRGIWAPRKRIAAGSRRVSLLRYAIVRLRCSMGERSHRTFLAAKQANSLALFIRELRFFVAAMKYIYVVMRLARKLPIINRLAN